jgi:hypothetical protein
MEVVISIEERVANGVRWLDEHAPANWRQLIDVEKLGMRNADSCVLGQVFSPANRRKSGSSDDWSLGFYWAGWKFGTDVTEISQFGFTVPWDGTSFEERQRTWDALHEEWTRVLTVPGTVAP